MKRRIHLLLALLFIISTLVTGLHELMPHHDSSSCQVCTIVQNDNALVPEDAFERVTIETIFEPVLLYTVAWTYRHPSTLKARAPPSSI